MLSSVFSKAIPKRKAYIRVKSTKELLCNVFLTFYSSVKYVGIQIQEALIGKELKLSIPEDAILLLEE